MKIAVIGASGFVGAKVVDEALRRGHRVTAIVQHPEKLPRHAALTAVKADAYDAAALAKVLVGHDAVISAFNPGWGKPDIQVLFVKGTQAIIAATRQAGIRRLLVVGGAGSLYVAPGVQLVDTLEFPPQFKQGALGAREALNILQKEKGLDWTLLSPAILLQPGQRTGKFRIGADAPLMAADGPGRISVEDLAVALLDETETPHHIGKRFTVAY